MSRCQTCIHSVPTFVTSDIYTSGFGQVCCDCKTKVKDGYEQADMTVEEALKILKSWNGVGSFVESRDGNYARGYLYTDITRALKVATRALEMQAIVEASKNEDTK